MTSGHTEGMKTAVSISDKLFAEAEVAARELGLSRSKLVQTALEDFLKARRDVAMTERINKDLADHPPTKEELKDEKIWMAHALENLRAVEWDE